VLSCVRLDIGFNDPDIASPTDLTMAILYLEHALLPFPWKIYCSKRPRPLLPPQAQFPLLGVCYILCMCVCVGVRQIRQLRLTIPSPRALPCAPGAFLGGSQGGAGMPPPGYAQRSAPGGSPGPMGFGATPRNFFLGGFCYF
jgi:hypothetical protein